jgi:hypothetical protein
MGTELDTLSETEIEAEAKGMGWSPLEEWRGDPDNWVTAEEFVERGKTVMPILKARNAELEQKLDNLSNQFTELHAGQQAVLEKERRKSYEQGREELIEEQRKAVASGEMEDFNNATKKLQDFDEDFKKDSQQQSTGPSQAALQFKANNPKYFNDFNTYNTMQQMSNWLMANNQYATEGEFFNDLQAQMDKQFGEKAPGLRDLDGGGDPPGSSRRSSKKAQTFGNLPDNVKASFQKFVREGVYKDEKEDQNRYASAYYAQEQ